MVSAEHQAKRRRSPNSAKSFDDVREGVLLYACLGRERAFRTRFGGLFLFRCIVSFVRVAGWVDLIGLEGREELRKPGGEISAEAWAQ
jgi:hypothetical protein